MSNTTGTQHIGIIGAGIIGLGVGWLLARRGAEVSLFERGRAGQATTRVAAGMLAPFAEVGFEELDLMKLGEQSLRLYPRFLEELKEDAGYAPEFERCGTLLAGMDRDDAAVLKRLYEFRDRINLRVERLTGTGARDRQPLLAPGTTSAIWLPDDAQIDNRTLAQALKAAFVNKGGRLYEQCEVERLLWKGEEIEGLEAGGDSYRFDKVVVAAGPWSGQIGNFPGELMPPLRPVKGQILTLQRSSEFNLNMMIRTPRVYLVPKADGTLRIGATSEERGFDDQPTAGGVKELLEEAWEAIPSIYDLPLLEVTAGLRPAARDNAPVIGPLDSAKGLYLATGHYRDGILYTPVTAYGLAEELTGGAVSESLKPYRPGRFAGDQQDEFN